ncbi:MAG: transglycosylase SLT domain-containing protein [Bdellovibrionales bacterium]
MLKIFGSPGLMKKVFAVQILFLMGCASLKRSTDIEVTTTVVHPEKEIVAVEPRYVGDPLSEKDIELINRLGSVPPSSHKLVKKWLDYFQSRGKPHMQRYLQRSTRYIPLMKKILKEEGVPEDLVYIALIESGFNAKAYSPAAAVGYWQFIRPTGKRYNLKITPLMDERKDVVASTRAAANYFKSLYNIFGNWYLAMASYNTGEGRVMRAIMRLQTRDFFEIVDRRRLPRETRNYVPKFLAAKLIGYYPRRFGFQNLDYQDEISFDTINVVHGVSLKKIGEQIGVPYERMKLLNPAYLSDYVPYMKDYPTFVRVPKGLGQQTVAILDQAKSSPPKYVAGAGYIYRVRRGDTLSHIARRQGPPYANFVIQMD